MPDHATLAAPDPILAEAPQRVGAVTLVVHDLDTMTGFYQDVIGLAVLGRQGEVATLGAGTIPLLHLRREPSARLWTRREAGLFHTAFLLPSRAALGAWLRFMAARRVPISGASDHIVSEAVYLDDPEGNGIEVYADRPSASWSWRAEGIAMSTEAMDIEGVMGAATEAWTGMPAGGSIGHVHLQTGDLSHAQGFYAGLLGFDITARYPGALFFGAGGYHHQLATNLWNSRGAPMRSAPTTGLAEVVLLAKGDDVVAATRARLTEAAVTFAEVEGSLLVRDPWGTALRLVSAA
jgi:catechol 2,3-dioxygenase